MEYPNTYVYFRLNGGDIDSRKITDRLGIQPTSIRFFGEKKYKNAPSFSSWVLSTDPTKPEIFIEELVAEIVNQLFDKIEAINELKSELDLHSRLEIVLQVDSNEEKSTPSLGLDLRAIEFLHRTQTDVDIDIYRFGSTSLSNLSK